MHKLLLRQRLQDGPKRQELLNKPQMLKPKQTLELRQMRKRPLMPRLGLMHRPLQTLKRAPPLELLLALEAAPAPLAPELV